MTEVLESRGLDKLRRWLEADDSRSQTTIAKLLGISQPSVSAWLRGRSRPDSLQRELLELHMGIPSEDWYTDGERERIRREKRRAARSGAES